MFGQLKSTYKIVWIARDDNDCKIDGMHDWRALLTDWSKELLKDERIVEELPAEAIESGWLGFEPATEDQIQHVEQRLTTGLPALLSDVPADHERLAKDWQFRVPGASGRGSRLVPGRE